VVWLPGGSGTANCSCFPLRNCTSFIQPLASTVALLPREQRPSLARNACWSGPVTPAGLQPSGVRSPAAPVPTDPSPSVTQPQHDDHRDKPALGPGDSTALPRQGKHQSHWFRGRPQPPEQAPARAVRAGHQPFPGGSYSLLRCFGSERWPRC